MPSPKTIETARPARLSALSDRTWTQVTVGKSAAQVWRIETKDEVLFAKTAPVHGANLLSDEVARLIWLGKVGIPTPVVHDFFEDAGQHWLVMSAVPGTDLTHLVQQPEQIIAALAEALRTLHAIDPATCPFDLTMPAKLQAAKANVDAGWVDETDFGSEHDGWTARAVFDWVVAHPPKTQDLVVAHGDACLPNFLARGGTFSGMIDVGRLGVADRWQDLALACRSLRSNCGGAAVAPFLAAYGVEWDEPRSDFYNTLDELF